MNTLSIPTSFLSSKKQKIKVGNYFHVCNEANISFSYEIANVPSTVTSETLGKIFLNVFFSVSMHIYNNG